MPQLDQWVNDPLANWAQHPSNFPHYKWRRLIAGGNPADDSLSKKLKPWGLIAVCCMKPPLKHINICQPRIQ